jgi:hypothetical protein
MGDTYLLMRMLGPMMVLGPMLVWLLVIGPAVIYPLARWRTHRDAIVDTQLGLKVALHYFWMLALQITLLGALLLLYAFLSKGEDRGSIYRAAFGFLVPGALVLSAHVALLRRTNEAHFPSVRRLFLGYNLIVTGLLGLAALVIAFQAVFAKGSTGDDGRLALAGVLVYATAWAASGWQFARVVLGDRSQGAPPDSLVPPAPAPAEPHAGAPTLPPLGGGSFPPISG